MKRYLIGVMLVIALAFALTACGEPPLEKANNDLNALANTPAEEEAGQGADLQTDLPGGLQSQYDSERDLFILTLEEGADLDAIFAALNENIEGQDVGTMIFDIKDVPTDDFAAQVNKKLSELSCNSLERIGVDDSIVDSEAAAWTSLSSKTTNLYLSANPYSFIDYGETAKKQLAGFTDVQLVYSPEMQYFYLDLLKGATTLSLVNPIVIQEDPAEPNLVDQALESDTDAAEAEEETESTTAPAAEAEGSESAVTPEIFTYYDASGRESLPTFGKMENLGTLLIYPDTGYSPDAYGELFLKSLSFVKPDLLVNVPNEAYTGENLIAVKDIETTAVKKSQANDVLADYLNDEVRKVYKKCKKYKDVDDDAVLTGKCLIYKADPYEDNWSGERKYSSNGDVLLGKPAKKKISVPEAKGDYETFVYIYPTYTETGKYDTGTKAYRQTLHVKVYNMREKLAYESETVGSAEAPRQFSYFIGSLPDKKSGEVSMSKVYDYLTGLRKEQ